MSIDREHLRQTFRERFGTEPRLFRAPGRAELIGNHTDYNDGFVFPVAIDREVVLAVAPRDDRRMRLYSVQFDQETVFELDAIGHDQGAPWSHYVRGVAWALQEAGYPLRGLDAVVDGDVPLAGGLSSSAAIEIATAVALERTAALAIDPVQRALLSQRAENEFVGVNCGIMDQFIAVLGRAGHGLLVDCRSLEYELVPLPFGDHILMILDTGKARELAASAYNERRATCEAAVAILQRHRPEIKALRDVHEEDLDRYGDELTDVMLRRARHVVGENRRVLEFAAAARAGDLAALGRLMIESHQSSRDLYQVSCDELDTIVELALEVEGVLGARMTGAGFGGAAIALAVPDAARAVEERILSEYPRRTGLEPKVYVCRTADGAGEVEAEVAGPRIPDRGRPADASLDGVRELGSNVLAELSKVIVGQGRVAEQMLVALLADGHVLLEGVPGIAKTLMVKALSLTLGLDFTRIQFTPDLMPSDVVGTNVYDLQQGAFHLRRGPIFTHLLLADEVNRTPPKTQAALLEAMEERQATIDGERHPLPSPFLVFATQNPIEYEGTYPLPEAQLDRFLLKIELSYPKQAEEEEILARYQRGFHPRRLEQAGVQCCADATQLLAAQETVRAVKVDPALFSYITALVAATRESADLSLGASPRASIALLLTGRTLAALRGRNYVIPDDIKEMAYPVLRHRVLMRPEAEIEGRRPDDIIRELLDYVKVPR